MEFKTSAKYITNAAESSIIWPSFCQLMPVAHSERIIKTEEVADWWRKCDAIVFLKGRHAVKLQDITVMYPDVLPPK